MANTENALQKLPEGTFAVSKYATDEAFGDLSSGSFLPRLQLCGASTNLAKEGKIKVGSFALIRTKESFEDLGDEVDFFVIAWRPRAMDTREGVVSFFNHQSEAFKDVVAIATNDSNSGCMFGPEFLIYLPELKQYATFYLNSATSRRESVPLRNCIGGMATVTAQLISNKKYKWHGPCINKCSQTYDLPPVEEMQDQAAKFATPPEQETEKADDQTTRAR